MHAAYRPRALMSLALLLCASALAPAVVAQSQPGVTVYRCTDASGRVALRDSPCADGQAQEVRSMLRPVDGAPVARPAPQTPEPAAAPASQVIVMRPAQPMYRCVRPDGSRYTSDSSQGNPRWVPLWTQGYRPARRGPSTRVEAAAGSDGVGIEIDTRTGRRPQGGYYGAGTWVYDECRPMPQEEICGVLTDRRGEIRRRFFNAQPTERAELTTEERSINTRLAQDCGR
jgi:hypothetical protein